MYNRKQCDCKETVLVHPFFRDGNVHHTFEIGKGILMGNDTNKKRKLMQVMDAFGLKVTDYIKKEE